MPLERVAAIAQHILALGDSTGPKDTWLLDHSARVVRLAQLVANVPELSGASVDAVALESAAWFHDAGWADQFRAGQVTRWQLLARPTSDVQRELAAVLVQQELAAVLPARTLRLAAEAIRESNRRNATMPEAQILAESEQLDEIGVLYVLRQFRIYQSEGRPIEQIVTTWKRQQEYRYWDLRVNDGFRFETTRRLARERLLDVGRFMAALARDCEGVDVREALAAAPASDSTQTPA